jgi:hypothetical protein
MKLSLTSFIALITVAVPALTWGAEDTSHGGLTADQVNFFEKNIRPVLIESCYKCHSADADKIKGGLTLDTKQSTLLGGESGHPGITPGSVSESSVYEAITWTNAEMQMPPKNKLPSEVIANFKKWIEMGAPDPRKSEVTNAAGTKRTIDMDEGRKHWAFQKPAAKDAPAVKTVGWAKTEIDQYVLSTLENRGLRPVGDADRATLIRRIAFDLTGLPPTPDEVKAFLADSTPDAVKRVIDGYLDSHRFGERWARHWLDVARYAESSGKDVNVLYPHAWRYRDYVIEAFNRDKPYDQFLKEQIAGDLMPFENKRDQAEKIIATGFLAIGSKGHNNRDKRQFAMDMVDEQIDAMSQSMLGLTLACARCHDHKFDAVSQRDYYALAGIFLSSETLFGTYSQLQNANTSTLIELDPEASLPSAVASISKAEYADLKSRHESAKNTANEIRDQVRKSAQTNRDAGNAQNFLRVRSSFDRAESVKADLDLFNPDGSPRTLAMGLFDRDRPIDSPILIRGDIKQASEIVPRGLVEVLCDKGESLDVSRGSGRLDLAEFIASKNNPLTARVMVNRIWLKLMGSALVPTPDNFGVMGQKPTHPELLDYLALDFVDKGWSVKSLIRSIMLSRVYQMGSTNDPKNYAADPDNTFHWRMSPRRLDAEAIRDATLAVSGMLNLYPIDGSPVARAGEGREGLLGLSREMNSKPYPYRSIYLPIVRDQLPEALTVFDFPDASLVNGERDSTNVPGQALYLMNHPSILGAADVFAARVAAFSGTPSEKMAFAYQLAFSRNPTERELVAIQNFWNRFPEQVSKTKEEREKSKMTALSAFCQSLIASAEFRYLN